MTNNVMINDSAHATAAKVASGSVVQGDWVFAYQTATDDMFNEARNEAYTAGSFAVQQLVLGGGTDGQVVGIALNNAASGDTVSVAHQGLFIGKTGGSVTAGLKVCTLGDDGIQDIQLDASGQGFDVGRALTGASAAAKYVLFRLNV